MSGPVHDIAYDGTTYVRVGLSGLIQTSTNGVDWTTRSAGTSQHLWGATWGQGFFCIVGENGRVFSSTDSGVTWTDHTASSATTEHLYSVAFADVFIACGTSGAIVMSGLAPTAWTGLDSGTTEDLWDISILDGVWTAVGDDDTVVYGNLTTDALDVTVVDHLNISKTALTDGSILNSSVTDGIAFPQKRFFHDEEDLQIWALAEDTIATSHVLSTTGMGLNVVLTENMQLGDRAWNPLVLMSEDLTFDDTLLGAYKFFLSEDVTFDDSPATRYTAAPEITETLEVSDSTTITMVLPVTVLDTLALDDVTIGNMVLNAALTDGVAFSVLLSESVGETEDALTWNGYVVNTKNFAVTQYQRYNFHSFAKFDGTYYGASDLGVYTLEGNYDDGWLIKALARSGILDFGSEFQKRMPRMYIGLRNDGTMVLKTITNEDTVRWYEMKQNQSGIAKSRVKGTKGVKSAYWQFELANITGDDFDIRAIELMPIVLSRRIK